MILRLSVQIDNTADRVLMALREEFKAYPVPAKAMPYSPGQSSGFGRIAVPLRLMTEYGTLSLISTTTIFGTALDIGLSELAIESFFPSDAVTSEILLGRR